MRFVSICTLFVVVLTLAIHNVSASPVKQGDQVNQGQNDLSKRADSTCTFVDDPNFTKGQQDNLHRFLTTIVGSNAGCQVTNLATKLSATTDPCSAPAIRREFSVVLDSLKTTAKTPRLHAGFPKYDGARVSTIEQDILSRMLPHTSSIPSEKMLTGLVEAISFPSRFFSRYHLGDLFYFTSCQ